MVTIHSGCEPVSNVQRITIKHEYLLKHFSAHHAHSDVLKQLL
jgi:hypothetical protein